MGVRGSARTESERSPAVRRAARILAELSLEPEGVPVADLARRLDAPKSSVGDVTGVLGDTGLVSRTPGGRVRLGPLIAQLARGFVGGSTLLDDFDAECARFASVDDHVVLVATLIGSDVAYLAVRGHGRPLPLTLRAGVRLPAWATATGLALLSVLTDDEIERLHRRNPPATPAGNGPRLDAVLRAVRDAREAGYATDDGLGDPALSGVAALIPGTEPSRAAVGLITPPAGTARARDGRTVRALAAHLGAAGAPHP